MPTLESARCQPVLGSDTTSFSNSHARRSLVNVVGSEALGSRPRACPRFTSRDGVGRISVHQHGWGDGRNRTPCDGGIVGGHPGGQGSRSRDVRSRICCPVTKVSQSYRTQRIDSGPLLAWRFSQRTAAAGVDEERTAAAAASKEISLII